MDATYPKDNLLTINPTITGTAKASAGYSITTGGLPGTLLLDANTGIISGTPNTVETIGPITMTVEGTDGSTVDSASFSIVVAAGKCHRLG